MLTCPSGRCWHGPRYMGYSFRRHHQSIEGRFSPPYVWSYVAHSTKIYFSLELGYLLIGALTKMTILFLYLRLFPSTSFKKMVYAVMSLVVVCCFVWEVISIFQCTPLDGAWLAWDGDDRTWVGKCRNVNAQGTHHTILS